MKSGGVRIESDDEDGGAIAFAGSGNVPGSVWRMSGERERARERKRERDDTNAQV